MTAIQILLRLRSLNVKVWTVGGELRYEAPEDALDEQLRQELESKANQIAEYLDGADDCLHTTYYVTMRDGVKIAVDVFRPKRDGMVVGEPLPVIWCHDRYHRSDLRDGLVVTKLDTRPWLRDVMRNGYVVGAVDARGTGASCGVRSHEFGTEEIGDAYDINEWFARQPWCDQQVGMFGDSYLGIAQFLAASAAPPHLKAIFPQMALFDLYSFLYPGGVFREDFVRNWAEKVRRLDTEQEAAPVGGHVDLAAQAVEEHRDNVDVLARAATYPYRDSRDQESGASPYVAQSPSSFLSVINASGVPVYQLSGWFDMWVRDALVWFNNLSNPQKLTIGSCWHTGREGIDMTGEHLRWFDHWLKGIDTGVMDEPPIRYVTVNAPTGTEWRTAWKWPPAEVRPRRLYFHEGPTGTIESANDGRLSAEPPIGSDGVDEYVTDYTTSSGQATRWSNGYSDLFEYGPFNANDSKALTYTTDVLTDGLEVTGNPVAYLHVSSTHPDGDFFVYLEDVDKTGTSHYVTEGVLRASHRAVAEPPFDYLGLPYHPCTSVAQEDLPVAPVTLAIDLHPTSYWFRPGHRLRLAVTCCDRDNASTPAQHPPPIVQVFRDHRRASHVDLHVMGTPTRREEMDHV